MERRYLTVGVLRHLVRTPTISPMNTLISAVANLDNLFDAWRDVRRNVRRSSWQTLLAELAEVDRSPLRDLRRIQQQLLDRTYRFSAKLGYAKRKSGGSRRGITVQHIHDRIVQRAVLNVFFSSEIPITNALGVVAEIVRTGTSFAGVPDRGVPGAIDLAREAIRKGATAFAYSDMKDFFPCVPRHDVIEFLSRHLGDQAFVALFEKALETELQNRDEMQEWLSLFPNEDVGVAQGSLLSTLVGNLALRQFDAVMNEGNLVTVRYLDDFLILAPDLATAATAFRRAQQELAVLKMECYAPADGSQKAALGYVRDGFQFLGCHIHPDGISPARSAKRKLLEEIARIISESKATIRTFCDTEAPRRSESTYCQTLAQIDRKLRGWGDVYRFVTNRVPFSQLDAEIDAQLTQFHGWFQRHYGRESSRARRRLLGVALLADTPPDEIVPTGDD